MSAGFVILLIVVGIFSLWAALGFSLDARAKNKKLAYDKEKDARQLLEYEAEKAKVDSVRDQARLALEHGFTLDQVILWTMSQIYFDPMMSVVIENEEAIRRDADEENAFDYFSSGGKIHGPGKRREFQKRIEDTKKYLFDKHTTPHEALLNRDFVSSMAAAGIEPKHDKWKYLLSESSEAQKEFSAEIDEESNSYDNS